MVGGLKWVLCSKIFYLRFGRMEYLEFLSGDFAPHRLGVQENTDE